MPVVSEIGFRVPMFGWVLFMWSVGLAASGWITDRESVVSSWARAGSAAVRRLVMGIILSWLAYIGGGWPVRAETR